MMRIEQGASWGRSWPLFNAAGEPVTDFVGWSAAAQVRATVEDDAVLWEWNSTPADGKGLITLADGAVTLTHDGADSLPWSWRLGVFDVVVRDATNKAAYIMRGRAMVIPAVTR